MLIISNLLVSASTILDIVLGACLFLVFMDVMLRWINPLPNSNIPEMVNRFTELLYDFTRRRINTAVKGFDFAPALVWIALIFLRSFLVRFLKDLGNAVK